MSNALLQGRIEAARRRTLSWLDAMQAANEPHGVSRISAAHDALAWPGVLLPGTYDAVMCRALIGGLDDLARGERGVLVGWLESFQRSDGVFRMWGMHDRDIYKKPDLGETWRYIDFHLTNYTLGAIMALDANRVPVLDFARPYLHPRTLKAWLADRDLRDPWQEGNNIVNLASFFLLLHRHGTAQDATDVEQAFAILFDWHDRNQEPATGFWGIGQLCDETRLLHAFAGSMHNFHLWYALDRPLPYHERAVDYALSRPPTIDSACIDVDLVDLLVHAHGLVDYRRYDSETWLRRMLPALLDVQMEDGGFCDVREGVRRQDGWVRGYEEPQGISNTFATWFRWIAIAMIADLLWPGRHRWSFRQMVGIGYRKEARE
jgi:hypothetical protein